MSELRQMTAQRAFGVNPASAVKLTRSRHESSQASEKRERGDDAR